MRVTRLLHRDSRHEKKVIRALGPSGDTAIEFSEADPAALAEANALFERLTRAGASAFSGRADEPMRRIDRLDQAGPETVLVPRNVAG